MAWRTVRSEILSEISSLDGTIANKLKLRPTLQENDQLTRNRSKRPTTSLVYLKNRCRHCGHSDQNISYGHIDDLKIRDSSHFFVFVNNANDKNVAEKRYEDDEGVCQCFRCFFTIRGFC